MTPPIAIDDWLERFRVATDADRQLQAHGAHYTCTFVMDLMRLMQHLRCVVRHVELLRDVGVPVR